MKTKEQIREEIRQVFKAANQLALELNSISAQCDLVFIKSKLLKMVEEPASADTTDNKPSIRRSSVS